MTPPADGARHGAPDPFEPFRRLVEGMSEATRTMLTGAAPGPPFTEQAANMADAYRASVEPLRAVLDEQRELGERLAAGLDQLRRLADDFGAWLEQHRRMVEQTRLVVDPLIDATERLASGLDTWAGRGPER